MTQQSISPPPSSEEDFQKRLKRLLAEDIEKNSKPLWITKKFVENPCRVIIAGAIVFIIAISLAINLGLFSMVEQHNREFLIWSNERVQTWDMQTQMEEDFQKSLGEVQIPERSQEEELWSTNIILECDGCNAFTKEGMKTLYDFEQEIKTHKNYKNFCLATHNSSECSEKAFESLTTFATNFLNKPVSQFTDSDIENLKTHIFSTEQILASVQFMFGKEFSRHNQQSSVIRSYMRFGTPIKIGNTLKIDKFDDRKDQIKEFNDFCLELVDIRDSSRDIPTGMDLLLFSQRLERVEFQEQILLDIRWTNSSVLFVFIYMSFHLKSIFLGGISMLQTLMSFPITQVLFRLVFQIDFFNSLHIMAIFVVLGIAADDVFVFMDAWRQTEHYKQLDQDPIKRLNQRMAITYRRASRAMLATSSTTSAAFLATGFSTIMPISSFGFYAGILIPINFLLVILFFPAIVIISETTFANMGVCFCCKKKKKEQKPDLQSQIPYQNQNQDVNEENLPKVERFFALHFSPFTDKFKYPILVIFAAWIIFTAIQTSKISAITKPEKFLPDEHKIEMGKEKALYGFHESAFSDTGITLYQFWGVEDIDQSDVSKWDPEELGDIKWDQNFDLSQESNQQFLFDYCTNMKSHPLVSNGNIDSFIFSFKSFAETQSSSLQFPVPQNKFLETLIDYTKNSVSGQQYYNQNKIGLIKNELKYIEIKIAAKGQPFKPYDELNPLYEKWQQLIEETNANAPQGLNNSKQTGGFHWTWMITEQAFVSNAVQGMLISLAFGLVVLLATTQNIVMAVFSLLSIIGIVLSVVSIMQLSGWEIGVTESITIVILIGLSIDYVVHLANHYVESVYPDRHRKMKVALRDLGVSIVSGAITTIGAGTPLLLAEVVIFNKFAVLILSTIFFSLIYALFFFSACMHSLGPENDCGSLKSLCKSNKICSETSKMNSKQRHTTQDIEMNNLNRGQNEYAINKVENVDQDHQIPS